MNKLFFVAIIAVATMTVVADGMPPAPTVGPVVGTERGRKKRRKLTPEMQMQHFGGFVMKEYAGRYCYFMNAQKRVPASVIEGVANEIAKVLSLPTKIESCELSGNDNFAPLRVAWSGERQTGAVISVIDVPNWTSLLIAPEDGWAQVNVAALSKDDPTDEVLSKRMTKELWRAFVILFGGGNAVAVAGDVMRPITSLKDLDSTPNLVPGPEPFNNVINGAAARGIKTIRRATYKQACVEGWAPAPTNDAQKAIWDKIHAMPTEPIKIKPETKPVKD